MMFVPASFTSPRGVLVGTLLLVIVLIVLGGYRWALQTRYLPTEQQKRVKKRLKAQLADQTPATLRLTREEYRNGAVGADEIDATFAPDAADGEPDWITLPEAGQRVVAALREQWGERTRSIPRTALALAEEAVVLLVLGVIVFVPSETIARSMGGGSSVTLSGILTTAANVTQSVVDTGLAVLATFPYADVLFGLFLSGVLTVATSLYGLWWQLAVALILGAIAITLLERRLPEDVGRGTGQSGVWQAITVAAQLAVIWIAGVVPAALGALAGVQTVGNLIGLTLATLVTMAFGVYWIRWLVDRLRRAGRGNAETLDSATVAYLLIRRTALSIGAISVPLAIVYALVAIGSGALLEWVLAIATAPRGVQIIVLASVVVSVAAIVYIAGDAVGDLRVAFAETLSRQSVRLALLGRGAPIAGTVIAFGLLTAILPSSVYGYAIAGLVALLVGLILRVAYIVLLRLQHRALDREREDKPASRAVIQSYRLDLGDDDGELFFARVNTIEVAHETREGAVQAILQVLDGLFEDCSIEPMIEREFATDALRVGFTDIEDSEKKLRDEVENTLFGRLEEENGRYDVESLKDDLEYCPEELVEDELLTWETEHEQIIQKDGYVYAV